MTRLREEDTWGVKKSQRTSKAQLHYSVYISTWQKAFSGKVHTTLKHMVRKFFLLLSELQLRSAGIEEIMVIDNGWWKLGLGEWRECVLINKRPNLYYLAAVNHVLFASGCSRFQNFTDKTWFWWLVNKI